MLMEKLLEVKKLKTVFDTQTGRVTAVNDISFSMGYGEVLGIVGESGSGKSSAMLSVMGLLPGNGRIVEGEVIFCGRNIEGLGNKAMRDIRGREIGMIFQDPMTSLNPVYTVCSQLVEAITAHERISKPRASEKAIEMLRIVGISDPEVRMNQYPHELSGGMRQRVMIAIAMCCAPKLLIADEPTSSLDVTTQAQILELMKQLQSKTNTSIILVTHDLGVVADICGRVIVMQSGTIVEQGNVDEIFHNPKHPYTKELLRCAMSRREKDNE